MVQPIAQNNPELGAHFMEYSDTAVNSAGNLIGTVLASILPVIAIIVLHFVHGTGTRLGLVAVFSALFSACLWIMFESQLVEVFSATSA